MPVIKQFLKTKPECKVKFIVSAEEACGAKRIVLVGDFNDWDPTASPMKKQKNGDFSLTLTLPVGGEHQFRYLADDSRWINDSDCDGYAYCSFAQQENSLLKL